MKHKDYLAATMFIFLIVAIVHLMRAFSGTSLMLGETAIPVWASWVAGALALYLSYSAYKLRS